MYVYAQRLRQLEDEAVAVVTGCRQSPSGELVLHTSTVPGEYLLPEILAQFGKRFPQVQVRVQVSNTQLVLQQLERGLAHVGLVGARSESPRLISRGFASDELILVVPPAHPWAKQRPVSLQQLTAERLLVREPGSGSRRCLEQALLRAGISLADWPNLMELGSNSAIKEAVQRGLGVAILSQCAVRDWIQVGQLVPVRVFRWRAVRHFYAVWRRDRPLPLPAQLFLDVLFARHKQNQVAVRP